MNNTGLSQTEIDKIRKTFARYPEIEKAILYGSRAKGTYKPASDIDLTLVGSSLDITVLQKIETDLDDLLLPYKIDLSIFHQISNKELTERIQRFGKLFFEK